MRFKGDPPPPQETTSPKTMAKTAVQAADSIKCSFAVGDIIPPIPCKPRGKPRKKKEIGARYFRLLSLLSDDQTGKGD